MTGGTRRRAGEGHRAGEAVVSAADIARLAGVGRSAVSNWRRRFGDFPRPVAGAPSNPLFALDHVEQWCRARGKPFEADAVDRLWQRVQAEVEGVRLAEFVAHAGAALTGGRSAGLPEPPEGWTPLFDALARAAADETGHEPHDGAGGAESVFSRLCERFRAARERSAEVEPDTAETMARLAAVGPGATVLDPACGTGVLLRAAASRGASVFWGQDLDPAHAEIARARLVLSGGGISGGDLSGGSVEVLTGDTLRNDGFPELRADAVLCDPPFRDRDWGWEELAEDERWVYGTPARGEGELAWVQHCLSRLRPGGVAAVRVPVSAAHRPSGRRVREALATSGVLRTVAELPGGQSLVWLLGRPDEHDVRPLPEAVEFVRGALSGDEARSASVPRSDLVGAADLRPATHIPEHDPCTTYSDRRAALLTALDELATALPPLAQDGDREPSAADHRTVDELVGDGVIELQTAPLATPVDRGPVPLLTHKDLRGGRAPSGRTVEAPGRVVLRPGDVVVSSSGDASPRVTGTAEAGAAIGTRMVMLRAAPERIDPEYLAEALTTGAAHSPRSDPRKARILLLPLDRQRAHVQALRRLSDTERRLARLAELGSRLVEAGRSGLADRSLVPANPPASEEKLP